MATIPTVAIDLEGERILINQSDFVEGVHKPWEEPRAKAAEPEKAPAAEGAEADSREGQAEAPAEEPSSRRGRPRN